MNRREVLTGMALASASVAIPAAALAHSMAQPDRAAWDRAFAVLRAANKASDDFEARFWPIEKAYQAAVKDVPHVIVDASGCQISTDNQHEVSLARHSSRNLRYVEACAYAGVTRLRKPDPRRSSPPSLDWEGMTRPR